MKEYLRYILYGMVYIVLCFFAVHFLQWFTKPVVEEGFAESMQNLVFAGIGSGGSTVYFADVDVPIHPRWIQGGTGVTFLAGSYGNLYVTTSASSPLKKGAYNSATWASTATSTSITQMSIDDSNGAISAVGSDGSYYYAASDQVALVKPAGTSVAGGLKWVSANNSSALGIGKTDGKIYFTANASMGIWTASTSSTGWKLVVFDGHIGCALKTDGSLYSVDQINNVAPTDAAWKLQGTMKFNHISLKAERLVGIATDGKAYYSNTYRNPSWTALLMKQYNSTGAMVGTSDISLTQIEIFDAPPNFRRKRFVTNNICNLGEEQIDSYCYQPCQDGRVAVGDKCPYKRKHILASLTCPPGYTYNNGKCIINGCPNGGTPSPTDPNTCNGITRTKLIRPPNTITPAAYLCNSDGSVTSRYVRIRPSSIVKENQICISSIVVKDSTGKVLSNDIRSQLESNPTPMSGSTGTWGVANATDGICADGPIGGTSCRTGRRRYISSGIYNTDVDRGFKRRTTSTYWEVDLQTWQNIKTIEFTGCNTLSSGILGMRLELLNDSGALSKPVVSRTFGKDVQQTFTFNFNNLEVDSCYEADCPSLNGESSTYIGDGKCAANSYDIVPRAILKPIILDDCYNQDGTMNTEGIPYSMYTGTESLRKSTCVKCPSKNHIFYAKGCRGENCTVCKSTTGGSCTTATSGVWMGTDLSTMGIPTAFADDYYNPLLTYVTQTYIDNSQGESQGAISSIASGLLSSLSRYLLSEKIPSNQYYVNNGIERQLTLPISIGDNYDNGICVEPCPPSHNTADDIKMVYNAVTRTYMLYGTTCSSTSQLMFNKPFTSAKYTPQIGDRCGFADNRLYEYVPGSGSQSEKCVEVCSEQETDNGDGTCSGSSESKTVKSTVYTCAPGLELNGYRCLRPCEAGTVKDGDYCIQEVSIIDPGEEIKCLKTSYAYTGDSGSGSSKTINKWLCDSQSDANALVKGTPDSATAYVRDNDILCVSSGDPTVSMYTCKKVVEPLLTNILNGLHLPSVFNMDYSYMCDNLRRAYADLSNNINIIQTSSNAYANIDTKSRNILTTLEGIEESLCAGEVGSSDYCNAIQTDIQMIMNYTTQNTGSSTQSPVHLALTSRDALLAQISKFQCKL